MLIPQIIRLALFGDLNVGKTSLIQTQNKLNSITNQISIQSVYINLVDCVTIVNNQIHIWDINTAPLIIDWKLPLTYRGAHGIVMVYDITNQQSFDLIVKYINLIKPNPNVKLILVGTKSDLQTQRVISTQQGQILAQSYQIPFIECSTKDQIKTDLIFSTLINEITMIDPNTKYQKLSRWSKIKHYMNQQIHKLF